MKQSHRKGSWSRQRRRQRLDIKVLLDIKIEEYVNRMCAFLDQTPKPSDLAVQAQFILIRDEWFEFCEDKECSDWMKFRFNREFKTIWKKRYRRPENPKSQESEEATQPLS